MKIIHCIYSLNTGGAETMLVDILNEQSKYQQIYLIIINKSYQEDLLEKINKNVKIIKINRPPKSKSIIPIIKLNYYLKILKPDAIHIHNSSLTRIILKNKCGIFFTAHRLGIPVKGFSKIKKIFAISESVKADILQHGNYPITTIYNGIMINDIKVKQNFDLKNSFKIVQVARLVPEDKGQDILIKALSYIKQNFNIENIYIDFIGDGEGLNFLKKLALDNNVQNQCNFLGLKDRKYIYNKLCEYDLMCHPARHEGFGLTIAEAMIAQLPILIPNEGGPFEITHNGTYGTTFKYNDAQDCAIKILDIYKNYNNVIQNLNKISEYAKANFSIATTAQKYLIEYSY